MWGEMLGEVVTVYNDGLNLVIRTTTLKDPVKTKNIESFNKYEVFTVESNSCTPLTKEVADIILGNY